MASPVAFSPILKDKANQLAVMLDTQGKKGRKAWEDLHGKLADVATSIADQTTTFQALLKHLKETGSLVLGYPDAEVLLRQMMEHVEEKVRAQSADVPKAIPLLKSLILQVAGHLNMTPLRNSVHLDMIDGDTTFAEENVDFMVNSSVELSAPSAAYTVVSIVGAQSSGKSYLLNHLFGTKFPVMNSKLGRSQTTRGILMSRCIEPSMLVLDIEGFDGKERGQDTLFENQAALFALTVSDLMMVNISIHDIGRENGGGGSLFKTIFQERTKLNAGLTNIVVVLRHCNGETPLEILRRDVVKRLEEMWRSVNKESTAFTDYVEISVVGLPDKDSEEFQKEVATLRELLRSFRSAKVPASSFSLSSKIMWDQIKQNKNLDLPSHMMLLATLYCQRTVEACMGQFDDELLKAEESPQGFKEVAHTLLTSIITQYNQETELYNAVIRDTERQKMVEKINKIFTGHSRELIRKIQETTSKQFTDEFAREVENMEKTDGIINYDDHKVESCVEEFAKLCEGLKVFDLEYFHNSCGELQKQLTSHTVIEILSLRDEYSRKAMQDQQRSEKDIDAMIMKLDERMEERLRIEEERVEERLRLEEEIQREKDRVQILEQEKFNKEKEESERRQQALENELEIQRERTRKLEEDRLEERRVQILEQEKLNKEKEEFERRQRTLENELEIQRERSKKMEEGRLEERARAAVEEQKASEKKIEELITKIDQRTEERQRREEDAQREFENNRRVMLEQEKHNREKEEFERRQRALENELQMQRERTIRLEEAQQNKSSSSGMLRFLFG